MNNIIISGIRTTTHGLAKELLSKPDDFLTVTINDKECGIECIKTIKNHANIDDGVTHKTIVCHEMSGNLR